MAIPSGVVVFWPGSRSSIPPGWNRLTTTDNRHTRGADIGVTIAGSTGGSASHGHTSDAHNHGATASHDHASGGTTSNSTVSAISANGSGGPIVGVHAHSVPSTGNATDTDGGTAALWTNVTLDPPYFGVIHIVSDGTPTGIPAGAITYWNTSTPPAGWAQHGASAGLYLKGAASGTDGGTTGGSSTHGHSGTAHSHLGTGHTHTGGTSGIPTSFFAADMTATSPGEPTTTHTHTVTIGSAGAVATNVSGGTTSTDSYEPPFYELLAIQPTAPDAPLGIICLWLGTIGTIPPGWSLCDGTNSTPDVRGSFIKAAASGGDVGTTGGAAGHTHTNAGTHAHDDSGHTHPVTAASDSSSTTLFGGTGVNVQFTWSPHTHALGGHSGAPNNTSGAFPDATQDVTAIADSRPAYVDVLFIQQTSIFSVAITDPTPSQVETTSTVPVAWTIAGDGGALQSDYTLNLYASDGVTLLYTSARVSSGTLSAAIPSGHVHTGSSYYVAVSATDTNGVSGSSALVAFSVLYTAPSTIADLTATPNPTNTPPSIDLAWTQPTISGGQVFVQTNIERRVQGTSTWNVLARLLLADTIVYVDYQAGPGTTYEYAVTTTVTDSGDTLTGDEQDPPPAATLTFPGVWLHVLGTPSLYLNYPANSGAGLPYLDEVAVPHWGRAAPTSHRGLLNYSAYQLTGVPRLYPGLTNGVALWATIEALLAAQDTAYVCLRLGLQQKRIFGVITTRGSSSNAASGYTQTKQNAFWQTPEIIVEERFFDEYLS